MIYEKVIQVGVRCSYTMTKEDDRLDRGGRFRTEQVYTFSFPFRMGDGINTNFALQFYRTGKSYKEEEKNYCRKNKMKGII